MADNAHVFYPALKTLVMYQCFRREIVFYNAHHIGVDIFIHLWTPLAFISSVAFPFHGRAHYSEFFKKPARDNGVCRYSPCIVRPRQ